MEEELAIVYLTLLKREPNSTERADHLSRLASEEITLTQLSNELKETGEYMSLQNRLNIAYDPATHVMSTHVSLESEAGSYDGVLVGNGKICMKTDPIPYQAEYSVISTSYDVKNLSVNNTNVIHTFKYNGIRFFDHNQTDVQIHDVHQKLNMYTAMFSTAYTVTREDDGSSVKVVHEIQALQQFPYCALQRVHIENVTSSPMSMDIFHTMEPSGSNLTNIEYKTNRVSGTGFFGGQGYDNVMKTTMAANNMYLYGDNIEAEADEVMILNGVYRVRVRVAANSTGVFSVVTGIMTEQDFTYPSQELTRILLTIKDYNLRADHNMRWISVWNTANIVINKRTDLTSEEDIAAAARSVELTQRNVRYAMYNLFSVLREDVNVDMNVMNLSAVDIDGEIFWNAEMFLLPVLIILRPECAKVLLNFRHQQLQFSTGVAAAFRNRGSQYVYKEDVANYKDMFWSPTRPATAFNTGLIGVNVWNYYKATHDRYWLITKGFAMLENCMRFFESLFKDDFSMKSVLSLSGYDETDNALTRYLAISVIRAYMEACYELSINVPNSVITLYDMVRGYLVILSRNVSLNVILRTLPIETTVDVDHKENIVFYNRSNGESVGSELGGRLGETLHAQTDQEYAFYVRPGVYVKFFDANNEEVSEGLEGSDALYSSELGFTDGVVKLMGVRISSYRGARSRSSLHGENAFSPSTTSSKVLSNVLLRPDTDSRKYLLETHLLLMQYYSRMLFNTVNPLERTMIIEHNYIYHKKYTLDLEDMLVENNLDGTLAQHAPLTEKREYYVDRFEDGLLDMFHADSTHVTRPWGNHKHSALLLFNILTGLLKIRVKGSITDKRFYSEQMGVGYNKGGFCMPRHWGSVTLTRNGFTEVLNNDYFVHE